MYSSKSFGVPTRLHSFSNIFLFVYINYFSKDNKTSEAMHLGALYTPYVKNRGEYWRFITSAFIHTEFLHLFMNMYCIFYLGRLFETILGPVRYLILVLVSIVMSSLATYYYSFRDSSVDNSITIGASGLFYGFLGAIIGLGLFKGGAFFDLLRGYLPCIAINLAFTLMNSRISKTGHVGGLVGGYLTMYIMYLLKVI